MTALGIHATGDIDSVPVVLTSATGSHYLTIPEIENDLRGVSPSICCFDAQRASTDKLWRTRSQKLPMDRTPPPHCHRNFAVTEKPCYRDTLEGMYRRWARLAIGPLT